VPSWSLLTPDQRRSAARERVAAWPGGMVRLRIAMPDGPGATLVYGQLAASLLAIGITPARVRLTDPADLALVDLVAPYDSARWYLANACGLCGGLRRLPALDLPHQPLSTNRRQTGILVDVRPVLSLDTEASQAQRPRFGPDGQPVESSQLGLGLIDPEDEGRGEGDG
jgi:peptide/nickel transport system substrate-binding protein